MPARARPGEWPAPPGLAAAADWLAHSFVPEEPALTPGDPLSAALRRIVGQQNTRAVAARQWEAYRWQFPTPQSALFAGPEAVAGALRGAGGGLSRVKGERIVGLLRALEERDLDLGALRAASPAAALAELSALPGLGPTSARLLMLFSLGQPAVPVNAAMLRTLHRLDWLPPRAGAPFAAAWLEAQLDRTVPGGWAGAYRLHVGLVRHARALCRARPRCAACALAPRCPAAALAR